MILYVVEFPKGFPEGDLSSPKKGPNPGFGAVTLGLSPNHEDRSKDIFSYPQITLAYYTPHNSPYTARNPVPHQVHIYSRDLENQLPDPTDRHGTDVWT